MANDFTVLAPKLLGLAFQTLRKRVVPTRVFSRDYDKTAAEKGAVITVPIPRVASVYDVTPAAVPVTPASKTPLSTTIALDKWKGTNFHITDKEEAEIDRDKNFVPMGLAEGVKAIVEQLNADAWATYKTVFNTVGTSAQTPFQGTAGTADYEGVYAATRARKLLNGELCPRTDRVGILNADAEANALALAQFRDVSQAGDTKPILDGEIGRKYGIDWFYDDQVPTHTSTAFSAGAATVNGAHAVGAGSTDDNRAGTVSIAKATNTSPLVAGDILTFAGDTQTYVVLADVTLAVGNTTVSIAPALRTSKAGAEAVTLKATHVVNLVGHKGALVIATRPLMKKTSNRRILSLPDPDTGLILRIEQIDQYKQEMWELDILYGVKLLRPELLCRIAG